MGGLNRLQELGQGVWYDHIERGLIQSGQLHALIQLGVTGVTSNPTIFERAVAQSEVYDDALIEGFERGKEPDVLYRELVLQDIQRTADLLYPVFTRTKGQDGYVSVEVSPLVAYDVQGTLDEAIRWWEAVDRPNLLIKIPATNEGIEATRTLIRMGISVNVTLVFALSQYNRVMEAYIEGVRQRMDDGEDLRCVTSVASFFVSRVDDEVDRRIATEGIDRRYMGTAAVANAKVAYAHFRATFESERFAPLREQGAKIQRILWASTGPKNPAYPHLLYVRSLIGKDSVNTMPPHILNLSEKQHNYAPAVEEGAEESTSLLSELEQLGISVEQFGESLLTAGVDAFVKSYQNLLGMIKRKAERVSHR